MENGLLDLKDIIFRAKTIFKAKIFHFLTVFSAAPCILLLWILVKIQNINCPSTILTHRPSNGPVLGGKRNQLVCLEVRIMLPMEKIKSFTFKRTHCTLLIFKVKRYIVWKMKSPVHSSEQGISSWKHFAKWYECS